MSLLSLQADNGTLSGAIWNDVERRSWLKGKQEVQVGMRTATGHAQAHKRALFKTHNLHSLCGGAQFP